MKIAVLSGKGGAGKTFLSVNLAAAAKKALYIDCDVEEPNGRIFLKPENCTETPVSLLLPSFSENACTGCRKCLDVCRFNALIYLSKKPMVFPDVCHSCGGCLLVCPAGAVEEIPREIGSIEKGHSGEITVVTGLLHIGEASGVPIIRQALQAAKGYQGLTVIDCPPGSSCSVMESVAPADLCLLVAEPTAFGFHNFQMVHTLCTLLGKPCAVVINKAEEPFEPLEDYCKEKGLPILCRIPFSREIAALAGAGEIAGEQQPALKQMFADLLEKTGGMVQ